MLSAFRYDFELTWPVAKTTSVSAIRHSRCLPFPLAITWLSRYTQTPKMIDYYLQLFRNVLSNTQLIVRRGGGVAFGERRTCSDSGGDRQHRRCFPVARVALNDRDFPEWWSEQRERSKVNYLFIPLYSMY